MREKAQSVIALLFITTLVIFLLSQETAGTVNAIRQMDARTTTGTDVQHPAEAKDETYTIAITIVGDGTVDVSPSGPYAGGETVTLTANPGSGYQFSGWSVDLTGGSSPIDIVDINQNYTITATFEKRCYPLDLKHTGTGADPAADQSSSPNCDPGQYHGGTLINLTAAPANHWVVESWDDNGVIPSDSLTYNLTMPSSAHEVTANYAPICFALNTSVEPAGKGSIKRSPATDADCPTDMYIEGTEVYLDPVPVTGYEFTYWNNNTSDRDDPKKVVMNAEKSMKANFQLACYHLTLTHAGPGSDPTATPTKSDLPQCSDGEYVQNEAINLVASPESTAVVQSWEGTDNDAVWTIQNSLTMPAADRTVTVTYIDKPTFQFASSGSSVNEPDGNALVEVKRSGSLIGIHTVDYATGDNTATQPADYTQTNGTLIFGPGIASKNISVPIYNDVINEGSESFYVTLSNPSDQALLGTQTSTEVTILDDDVADPTVRFSAASYSVDEETPSKAITVSLFPASTQPVLVKFNTQDDTAISIEDYLPVSNASVTFWPGETSQEVDIDIIDDQFDEPDENVTLLLSDVVNALLDDTPSTLTIIDDDQPPTVQFDPAEYYAKEGDPTVPVTVTLSAESALAIAVEYEVIEVKVGLQFVDTVVFDPGETSKTISVPVGDKKEGDQLNILIKSAENASLGQTTSALITILDKNRSDCHQLTLTKSGYGQLPVTTNIDNSIGCAKGHFVAGIYINVEGLPDSGWIIDGWYGTTNDASKSNQNVVQMPDGDHTVEVHYITSLFLATIENKFINYFAGPQEIEPNNRFSEANGPLESGKIYFGSLASSTDKEDRYYFQTDQGGNIQINLTDIPVGHDYNLYLYDTNWSKGHLAYSGSLDNSNESITKNVAPGIYYVRIVQGTGGATSDLYKIKVTYN